MKIKNTLLYYDGPVLFVGQDEVDTMYICQLITRNEKNEQFLCIPISRGRLEEFQIGNIDLKLVFKQPEVPSYYLLSIENDTESDMVLKFVDETDIDESWFPDEGFFLETPYHEEEDKLIIKDSIEKQTAVLHFAINPPESRKESKISSARLIQGLQITQGLIREAYKKAIRDMGKPIRKLLDNIDNYQLDVYGVSEGSFNIHFQAKTPADMYGFVEIERALGKIDELTDNIGDQDSFLKTIRENKGHLATYYLKLLEFVIKNDAPIYYSWTSPSLQKSIRYSISKKQAIPLYERLSEMKELTTVEFELIGSFVKADTRTGRWTVLTENSRLYHGDMSERGSATLSGIVLETKKYKFLLEEQLIENVETGIEKTSHSLISFDAKE